MSVLNSNEMDPERIRKGLLGAIRYGKALVFDMEDANLFKQIEEFINRVQPDLYSKILDMSILKGKLSNVYRK